MKNKLFLSALLLLCLPALAQTPRYKINAMLAAQSGGVPTTRTWYVRADGGGRYDTARVTLGGSGGVFTGKDVGCNGMADASYAVALAAAGGATTNLPCAFNDYRFLYDDQTYNNWAWVISGGDTVILDPASLVQFRTGWDSSNGSSPIAWCFGPVNSGPYGCTNPTVPAGTPTQHTRILGRNYQSCAQNNMSQIFGGFGQQMVLNLRGAQFVDVECIELTRHSQCIQHGTAVGGAPGPDPMCKTIFPGGDDYASDGILTDVNTHDLLLQDMWIHGFPDRGIIGPIGGVVTAQRVDIAYSGMAGWDFDDGSGSNNGNGTASVNGQWSLLNSTVEWSGCNQTYPFTSVLSCYSQGSSGYGDGVGTPPGTCLAATINGSSFHNNTQDALDLGHGDTGTNCPLTITNSIAYANNGATFKWGPNENPAVFTNNFMLANCLRMSQPITGEPSSYNLNLADFCRAKDAVSFNFRQGGSVTMTNNTLITYAPTSYDIQCWDTPGAGLPGDANTGCGGASLTFKNNITRGYDNPATYRLGGRPGGPGGMVFSIGSIGTIAQGNNTWYGMLAYSCLPTERCTDPDFVGELPAYTTEAELDVYDTVPVLSVGSPSAGQGATSTAVATPPPVVVTPPPVNPPPPSTPPPVNAPPGNTPTAEVANAVTICSESPLCTITAVSDPTAVFQFGASSKWCPTTIRDPALPLVVSYASPNPVLCAFDPDPSVIKTFVGQQMSNAYEVTFTLAGPSTLMVVTVPALSSQTSAPPVATPPVTGPTVQMANAYKICDEGCTIVGMPVGTVYQFGAGAGATWLPAATSTSSSPALPLYVYYTSFPVGSPSPIDPDYGVVKQFDVRQTTQAQTIVYTASGNSAPVTVTVPALK
jgi:hypothetical protein